MARRIVFTTAGRSVGQGQPTSGEQRRPSLDWAPIANLFLGLWLFASVFIWPHYRVSRTNILIVGLLIAGFAVLALRFPRLRYVDMGLAVWLLVSTVGGFYVTRPTAWNDTVVAFAVFVFSLAVGNDERSRRFTDGGPGGSSR